MRNKPSKIQHSGDWNRTNILRVKVWCPAFRRRPKSDVKGRFVAQWSGCAKLSWQMKSQETCGWLALVATPIGNMEDITLRALRLLKEADVILAEDTRKTIHLLRHHHIGTPLVSFHAQSSDGKAHAWIEKIKSGQNVALVTDAGSPVISDPGAELSVLARAAGVPFQVIPGVSSVITALLAAQFPISSFRFLGFLPRKGGKRTAHIKAILQSQDTVVIFEAANRVKETLIEFWEAGLKSEVAIARELTKTYEEIIHVMPHEREKLENLRGEVTLVIAPTSLEPDVDQEALAENIRLLLEEGLGTKAISDMLAETHPSLSKSDLYQQVIRVKKEKQ